MKFILVMLLFVSCVDVVTTNTKSLPKFKKVDRVYLNKILVEYHKKEIL